VYEHASVSAQVQINKLKVVDHCSGSETTIVLMWCVPEVCAASLFLAGLKLLLVLALEYQRSDASAPAYLDQVQHAAGATTCLRKLFLRTEVFQQYLLVSLMCSTPTSSLANISSISISMSTATLISGQIPTQLRSHPGSQNLPKIESFLLTQ
jgi:hypothetical protein